MLVNLRADALAEFRVDEISVPPGKLVQLVLLPAEIPMIQPGPTLSSARGEFAILRIPSLEEGPSVTVDVRKPREQRERLECVYSLSTLVAVEFVADINWFSPR